MKRTFIYCLLIGMICSGLSAQTLRLGAAAGLLNANANSDFSVVGVTIEDLDDVRNIGFYVGIVGDIGVSDHISLQAELNYGNAGDLAFFYLPIQAKYEVLPRLYVLAGPQISLSSEVKGIKEVLRDIDDVAGNDANLDSVLRTTGIDFSLGAGFEITRSITAQLRYSFELTNRYNGPLKDSLKVRTATISVGAIYFL